MKKLLAAFFMLTSISASALDLGMPVRCQYGVDCFVQNYMDVDPTPGRQDFLCHHLTYDGHNGTDFRLRNYVDMRKGYDVVASADGKVVSVRNGMEDINIRDYRHEDILEGIECGNGVRMEHDGGWMTIYCHLMKDTIVVSEGDKVKRGQKLGQIGLSGMTEFPHVHFAVSHNGTFLDPFTGKTETDGCHYTLPDPKKQLWNPPLPYYPTALLGMGFSTSKPDIRGIREGRFNDKEAPRSSDALVLWVDVMGVFPGDNITLSIYNPSGELFHSYSKPIKGTHVVQYVFGGKKRLESSEWAPGRYKGILRLTRGGAVALERAAYLQIN